ncbi:lipase 3-like [Hyposmocoma kahamanoa]|uniref:lipase 3-like n=1 Tax=Hyposmocoma kahamanoa TaxID=1477025 RepID=UPI000E6D9A15|nr:lipase 3-like [Hyposmocoma kahamanoa]
MAVITCLTVFLLFVFRVGSSVYETHQHIERAGYVAETHRVTTEDGYILEMYRIPFRRGETSGSADRPVVFFLHGLLAASISFIRLGRNYAIAYNLADAGFDVWLGNARGNRNSRFHVSLDPDANAQEFFDFTWHEIGVYDIPAMIDYILEETGNQRLHYIGHSQGGTAFFVMASMRPEYNEKIALAHLLAPAGYKTHFPHPILRPLTPLTNIVWSLAVRIGVIEIFPPNPVFPLYDNVKPDELWQYCFGDIQFKDLCLMTGIKEIMESYDDDRLPGYFLFQGGASLKQIAHYGQNIKDDSFRQWDYGAVGNIANYGTRTPPVYNMSLITSDVEIHYTVSDTLVGVGDVYAMAEDMPNCKLRRVARENFGHGDFVEAKDARELVTAHIIEVIQNYDGTIEEPEIIESESNEGDSSSTIVLSMAVKIYLIIFTLYSFL